MKSQTRDGYTREEAESYYHNTFDENYTPRTGNDSTAFWDTPPIDEILGSSLGRWTIGGIIRRAKSDAKNGVKA